MRKKTVSISSKVEVTTDQKLKQEAEQMNVSKSRIVEIALNSWLEKKHSVISFSALCELQEYVNHLMVKQMDGELEREDMKQLDKAVSKLWSL